MQLIHLAAGLVILVIANIILGSIGAWLDGDFDGGKLWKGIVKGGVVSLCTAGVWYAGHLNPDILAVNLNGTMVNLSAAVTLLLTAAFVFYGAQVVKKLAELFGGSMKSDEIIEGQYEGGFYSIADIHEEGE